MTLFTRTAVIALLAATPALAQETREAQTGEEAEAITGQTTGTAGEGEAARIIVRQPAATVRVYEPAATIIVRQPAPRIIVRHYDPIVTVTQREPEVSVTPREPDVRVELRDPEVIVDQAQPTVAIEQPEPRIAVEQPEPAVDVTAGRPEIAVRTVEPRVAVSQPEPEVDVQSPEFRVEVEQAQPQVEVLQEEAEVAVQTTATPATEAGADLGIVVPVDDIVGLEVVDLGGNPIGDVEDVLLDPAAGSPVVVVLVDDAGRLAFDYQDFTFERDRAVLETGEGRQALAQGRAFAEGDFDPLPAEMTE